MANAVLRTGPASPPVARRAWVAWLGALLVALVLWGGAGGPAAPAVDVAARSAHHHGGGSDPVGGHVTDGDMAGCPAMGCYVMGCAFVSLSPPELTASVIPWTRIVMIPPADDGEWGRSVAPPLRPPRHA